MVILAGENQPLFVEVKLGPASLEISHQFQQVLEPAGEAVEVDGVSLADIPKHL